MKKYFFIVVVIFSIFTCFVYANKIVYPFLNEGIAVTKIESNSCYIYMDNNEKVDYILLAGPNDRSYFYFPCGAVNFSKRVSVANDIYYIVNVKVRTSPQEGANFIRVIKVKGHDLIDEKELSYSINSCFSLDSYSLLDTLYISYLILNKNKLNRICDEGSGEIVIGKKTNLYNFFSGKFSKKGYLIKDDKVVVSRYMSVNGEFWLYVSYGDKVKRWIKMNDIFKI